MTQNRKRFLIDENGRKTSVVLPVRQYEELLEDLASLTIIAERKAEPAEPLEVVKERLEKKWLNTGSKYSALPLGRWETWKRKRPRGSSNRC